MPALRLPSLAAVDANFGPGLAHTLPRRGRSKLPLRFCKSEAGAILIPGASDPTPRCSKKKQPATETETKGWTASRTIQRRVLGGLDPLSAARTEACGSQSLRGAGCRTRKPRGSGLQTRAGVAKKGRCASGQWEASVLRHHRPPT